jgi:peptidoglycan hydrolase-like protein with peptidoglycan-binding domain
MSDTDVRYETGQDGDHVRDLQGRLQFLGYYEGQIDGSFGQSTEQAVREYQTAYGESATGALDSYGAQRLRDEHTTPYQYDSAVAESGGYTANVQARREQQQAQQQQPEQGAAEAGATTDQQPQVGYEQDGWRWDGQTWQPIDQQQGSADQGQQPADADGPHGDPSTATRPDVQPDQTTTEKVTEKLKEPVAALEKAINGDIKLDDLKEAKTLWKLASDVGTGLASTAKMGGLVLAGMIELITFQATADRLYGFAYGVVRGAAGYGEPPLPSERPSDFREDAYNEGGAEGVRKVLGDDKIRNQMLLYLASKGDDENAAATAVLREVWTDLVDKKISGPANGALKQWTLNWPDP